MASPTRVSADFDRIARLADDGWDHNAHYHAFLLGRAPARCRAALDIGSGTGTFSRLMAGRSDRVLGLDLSPEMVRVARERSAGVANVEYRVADFMDERLGEASFDCIAALATLHHVPLAPALGRIARLLAPGGVLLILDLYRPQGLGDGVSEALAVPVGAALKLVKRGRLREPAESRAAWAEHGAHDVYPSLGEVRAAAATLLPGARIKRHLLWRYSLTWRK